MKMNLLALATTLMVMGPASSEAKDPALVSYILYDIFGASMIEVDLTEEKANEQDDAGWTPLMAAAWKGKAKIAKVLVDHGANLNTCDDTGMTPLMMAAYMGHADVVKVLIEAGADVKLKNANKQSGDRMRHKKGPLGYLKIYSSFRSGETALMIAERQKKQDIVELLKEAEAKAN